MIISPEKAYALREIEKMSFLGVRLLEALRSSAHNWPGELRVSDVKPYDESRTQLTLTFAFNGVEWSKTHLDCCPEAHVEEALCEAISFFVKRSMGVHGPAGAKERP